MKLRLLWHIVRRQFITQRLVIIPFILAVSVLFMIEYTLVSIGLNSYIKHYDDMFNSRKALTPVFSSVL
ncbi:hypothetical protein [Staphylococcus aureus]|uniref:hypothetical protein n=1 Tax=Staphylococcus aureus TaxID=1280 RepID=UPI00044AA80D|nr:hypothetical protein [Staphylococcus aureus]EZV09856.1 hypothetical protein U914_00417 [Staphylococcus aureus 12-03481]